LEDAVDTSPVADGSATQTVTTTIVPQWPVDTDIIFSEGRTRIRLMNQKTLIRMVLQDAISNVHANLVFGHAFPDAGVAFASTRAAVVNAAMGRFPSAGTIHNCLLSDMEYLSNMIVIVSILALYPLKCDGIANLF